ncbi:MAG: (d)CMP kinase [Kiritimatiellae bacterium]|jgi:cyclohexadieny/prephenate dehydrogenase|nr:(d)CMP kinase [Kiritimatiellia bacterium]
MKTIALVGVGLMGGSIGLALRARNVPLRIQVYARRQETRDAALTLGMADTVFDDPAEAVADADLVIVCVPVCAIPTLLQKALPGLKHDAVVTDVGSTKAWLAGACAEVLKDTGATFVGSHPMCGSEKTGLEVADANLYQGATCIVTADASTRDVAWQVSHFWTRIGARVVEMPAVQHDQVAAITSHVPHLAASALVLACGEASPTLKSLIGPGFRDSTRIASGSPTLWRDIIETYPTSVCEGLKLLQDQLSTVMQAIESNDFDAVEQFLERGVQLRNDLCKDAPLPPHANGVIAIDGPSASGKSTVARSIAKRMNSLYVDSGALYRGMTWMVLQAGAHPESEAEVLKEMQRGEWDFPVREGAVTFTINGTDPGEAIRGEAVRENVSYVARIPEVRRFIVDQIRSMRALGPLVVEGRDIGSVVFPESPHKFYLDADPVERARRRNEELLATESDTSVEAVQESLRKRDHLDSTRKTAPLQIAEGARVVDTTELTLDEVVDRIIGMVRAG